jgi:hypothetical protein
MRKLRRRPKPKTHKRRAPTRPLSEDNDEELPSLWPGDGEDGIDCGGAEKPTTISN